MGKLATMSLSEFTKVNNNQNNDNITITIIMITNRVSPVVAVGAVAEMKGLFGLVKVCTLFSAFLVFYWFNILNITQRFFCTISNFFGSAGLKVNGQSSLRVLKVFAATVLHKHGC